MKIWTKDYDGCGLTVGEVRKMIADLDADIPFYASGAPIKTVYLVANGDAKVDCVSIDDDVTKSFEHANRLERLLTQ